MASLPHDLSNEEVLLDCAQMQVSSPSFLDEVVKQVLIMRSADRLAIEGASQHVQILLQRAASNRGVTERLSIGAAAA